MIIGWLCGILVALLVFSLIGDPPPGVSLLIGMAFGYMGSSIGLWTKDRWNDHV